MIPRQHERFDPITRRSQVRAPHRRGNPCVRVPCRASSRHVVNHHHDDPRFCLAKFLSGDNLPCFLFTRCFEGWRLVSCIADSDLRPRMNRQSASVQHEQHRSRQIASRLRIDLSGSEGIDNIFPWSSPGLSASAFLGLLGLFDKRAHSKAAPSFCPIAAYLQIFDPAESLEHHKEQSGYCTGHAVMACALASQAASALSWAALDGPSSCVGTDRASMPRAATHCGNGFDAGFSPYQSTRSSRYNTGS